MKTKYKTFKEMSKDATFITYDTIRTGRIVTSSGTFPVACSSSMIGQMLDNMLCEITSHCKNENYEKYSQALHRLPDCYQLSRFCYDPVIGAFCYGAAQNYRAEMSKIRKFLRNFYKNHFNK